MSKNPVYDTYRQDLPETALTPTDIGRLKFGIALRGYAMSQVDDVLDRLAREIAERDARIAELTSASRPILAHEAPAARPDNVNADDVPNP